MPFSLDAFLQRFIIAGRYTVVWPDGATSHYGGVRPGPEGGVRLADWKTVRRVLHDPGLAFGEAYMDGRLKPVDGTVYDAMDVLLTNLQLQPNAHGLLRLRAALRWLRRGFDQHNPVRRAQRNVAHHYDLNGRLYSLFLDRDRQYSCGYFPTGNETLEEAQAAKKHHIAAKLCLDRPGLEVLDIGCGWGGMALTLARDFDARVTGITLSTEQLHEARARAAAEGLADRVRFELRDYRDVPGTFDRIVSVGMFEHVGLPYYRAYFDSVARLLRPDGVALIHAIGRLAGPAFTNRWLAKYIFPGGYSPALSEVIPVVERSGLLMADIEILRLHYAQTLRLWRRRFAANRDAIASLYDERFCRMFEFYLAAAELSFRVQNHMVWQLQLAHRQDAVPLTRTYIAGSESAVRTDALTGAQGRQ
ncbi:MAG TPA: cyclopropane-fatty-acyl-phospholipid synthase family protein [Acidisphaera sp.]|nr:cyclopropane-fatty-acyl-phospholipid synthase family protein [Acidisphaera sp.]